MYIVIYMKKKKAFNNKTRIFMTRFTEPQYKILKHEAVERNISVAALIRQAVAIYIKETNR